LGVTGGGITSKLLGDAVDGVIVVVEAVEGVVIGEFTEGDVPAGETPTLGFNDRVAAPAPGPVAAGAAPGPVAGAA